LITYVVGSTVVVFNAQLLQHEYTWLDYVAHVEGGRQIGAVFESEQTNVKCDVKHRLQKAQREREINMMEVY
jgi:hypothetical protein